MAIATRPRTDGPLVADFIELFCRQSRGEEARQPVRLRPWQREILDGLFALGEDGRRKHQTGLVGLPRKNGKSTLGSGLALYLLVADGEPGAEVYSCAGDRKQARIVFGEAKKMVQAEPELSDILTCYADAIEHKASQSVYRVLSADAALQQGLNPSACIFDEVHVQPTAELWDAIALGMGTRRQPLLIGITTAGHDEEGRDGQPALLWRLYEYGKKVQSGEIEDPSFYFKWYEPADPKADWLDPKVWAEANPALGDFLNVGALAKDARITQEGPFRRYHLNQWTSGAEVWLPFGAWEACKEPALELDPSLPLFVAVDVALRNDSTAVVCAQRQVVAPEYAPKPLELLQQLQSETQEEDGLTTYDAEPEENGAAAAAPPGRRPKRTVIRAKIWENPYAVNDARHQLWKLDIRQVELWLLDLYKRFPEPACEIDDKVMAGPEYSYDPAYFHRSADVLGGEQLAMVEFPQTDSRMIPASQSFYQLVVEGKIAHDGDPALTRHIGNAAADQKPRGWRLTKPKGSRRKIDAAVAGAIATYRAQNEPPKPRKSRYEREGIRTL